MDPDNFLSLTFFRAADRELLRALGPFVEAVVTHGLWEQSYGSVFRPISRKFFSGTIEVRFVTLTWPGTPLVLDVRESGFHQSALGLLLADSGGRAAAEVEFGE